MRQRFHCAAIFRLLRAFAAPLMLFACWLILAGHYADAAIAAILLPTDEKAD
jgi:hypothetical protein